MNLFADIHDLVLKCLDTLEAQGVLPEGLDVRNVAVEPPRDPAHGDMATNAAMVLAKPAKQKPRDIAEALAKVLLADPRVTEATVAGPGFLNLRLDPDAWRAVVPAALDRRVRDSPRSEKARKSTSNTSRRTRRVRSMSGTRGVRSSATRLPRSLTMRATTSRANITSTMAVRRSMCSPGPSIFAIARPMARRWSFPMAPIPAITSCRSGRR